VQDIKENNPSNMKMFLFIVFAKVNQLKMNIKSSNIILV